MLVAPIPNRMKPLFWDDHFSRKRRLVMVFVLLVGVVGLYMVLLSLDPVEVQIFSFTKMARLNPSSIPNSDSEEIPTGQASTKEIPTGQVSSKEIPRGEVSTEEIPTGEVSTKEIPTGQVSIKEISKIPVSITETTAVLMGKTSTTRFYSGQLLVNTSSICKFPEIDPFDTSIETYLFRYDPVDCSTEWPNFVSLENDELVIDTEKVKETLANLSLSTGELEFCQYNVLARDPTDDHKAYVVGRSAQFNTSLELDKSVEDVRVDCYEVNGTVISRSYFSIVRVQPEKEKLYQELYKAHLDKHQPAETLSILMLGLDGLSRQHFARAMPKTREFLLKELGAIELRKYNKLGSDTFDNVIPLLSGRTYEELRDDPMWTFDIGKPMDQINEALVWSEARRLGYRTGLVLDWIDSAFHYLKRGFKMSPVDHYLRATVVNSEHDGLMRSNSNCYGDEPEVTKLYEYWLQLLRHYNSTTSNRTPFFAYSFMNTLTHSDPNMAFAADEFHLKFLTDLKATNAINNTVIVFFSDHGERLGYLRHTIAGQVEANTPMFFYAFPPWFEKKYPEVMRVFRTNQDRLTSCYDMHATLQDLLYFKGVVGEEGKLGQRGISLFREIPLYRTCKDVQIPEEYCMCSPFLPVKLNRALRRYLGEVVTNHVMSLLRNYTKRCAKLTLKSVEGVQEKQQKKEYKLGKRHFRVSIMTEPGRGQFEARVTFDTKTRVGQVVGKIARTNMYRGQSECMRRPELRNYCYCKTWNPMMDLIMGL